MSLLRMAFPVRHKEFKIAVLTTTSVKKRICVSKPQYALRQ
jgi:hypothetical protein